MTNQTPIAPALTPEDWASKSTAEVIAVLREQSYLPRTIALANHALPDSHPGKLTWGDVQECEVAAANHDHTAGLYEEDADQLGNRHIAPIHRVRAVRCRALAQKLAAMLPPKRPDPEGGGINDPT